MRKLIVAISLFYIGVGHAQLVPLQSQYMFNGIALNPAFTGSEDAFSIIGSMRAQWLGFPGAPKTQALTAHAPLKGMKSAVGVQFYADQIGVYKNTGIFGSYAYRLKVSKKSTLSFGVSGGLSFVKNNYSQLQGNDLDDASLLNDSPLGILPDASFGMHYYSDRFFVNLSLPMFLSHTFEDMKFKIENNFRNYNIILGGGYLFKLKNKIELKPSLLGKYKADTKIQFDFNLTTTFNKYFELGLSYRTSEAIIALFKININQQFSIMYSAGLPLNSILKHSFGSHELSLKYTFLYRTQITSPRFLGW
jgi:type IX secretion system PorP/SprF family membrane protein